MILLRRLFASLALLLALGAIQSQANPYLAKPGEAPVPIRVAACAISGGFMHLYTALDNRLFEKYGLKPEFLLVRGEDGTITATRITAGVGGIMPPM